MRHLLLLCAAAQAYREEIGKALTPNLLMNGGPDEASMNGWHDVVPGLYNATPPITAGWEPHIQTEGCETPENPQPCEHVFKTSYQACTRRQTVPLVTHGVTEKQIDAGEVAVVISEDVKEFYSVDKFFIRAALCRDEKCTHKLRRWAPCRKHSEVSTEEAYQWCETKGGAGYSNDVWENHNHTFGGGDMVGARYLLFEDGGVDSEYYKGLYGPWFKDASVVIHKTTFTFAPTATPAPSAPTLKPTFQPTTKYKSEFWDDDMYSYYGGGDDQAAAAATPAPKPRPRPHTRRPTPPVQPAAAPSGDDGWMYVAAALLAVVVGFGVGFCIRARRAAPANPYAIAGTQLDDDDEGVEMAATAGNKGWA